MFMNRRDFITSTAKAGLLFSLPIIPNKFLWVDDSTITFTLLHTNNLQSNLFPVKNEHDTESRTGGIGAHKKVIDDIVKNNPYTLLVDAGDFCGDGPVFDTFKGKAELEALKYLGYHAFTLGEKDFMAGIDHLANNLTLTGMKPVVSNYDFTHTALQNCYEPYKIIEWPNLKIGIMGIVLPLHDKISIPDKEKIVYLDAVEQANTTANYLKQKNCNMIICLSHLGDRYSDGNLSDEILAKNNYDIDVIVGGHTQRFFKQPRIYQNKSSGYTIVNQAGWGGVQLAQLDFEIDNKINKNLLRTKNFLLKEKKNQ